MEIVTTNKAQKTIVNIGTKGAPTLEVREFGNGKQHVTEIILTNFVIGVLPAAAAAKVLVPITKLYELPAGSQIVKACLANIALTGAGTAVTPEVGIGSVAGDGSVNADLGTAGATQEDYVEGFAVADTATHAEVSSGIKVATAGALTGIALNNVGDAKTLYLNVAGTWNADNTGNLTASGKVVIVWDSL